MLHHARKDKFHLNKINKIHILAIYNISHWCHEPFWSFLYDISFTLCLPNREHFINMKQTILTRGIGYMFSVLTPVHYLGGPNTLVLILFHETLKSHFYVCLMISCWICSSQGVLVYFPCTCSKVDDSIVYVCLKISCWICSAHRGSCGLAMHL